MKAYVTLFFIMFVAKFSFSQSQDYIDAQKLAEDFIKSSQFNKDDKRNIITDNKGIIHIFLFEDGNLLNRYFPTTATERDKFQVHLYVRGNNSANYLIAYDGKYEPTFNVQGSNPSLFAAGGNRPPPSNPQRIDFAIAGPFTGSLVITVKKLVGDNYNSVVSSTIKIAKTIHASIGAAPIYTTLKNPSNIKTLTLPDGTTTLVADDTKGRALLTVMASIYPWGRNDLLLPGRTFKDIFGVVIGTSIANGSSNFKDVLLGGELDFAIGGSIVAGLHYGRIQKVAGYDLNKFSFGKETFSGDLESKKYMGWEPGFFIGVQIDSRIFNQLFSRN